MSEFVVDVDGNITADQLADVLSRGGLKTEYVEIDSADSLAKEDRNVD